MAPTNQEVAAILRKMADTLEIYLDNPYRIRAYRKAARSIENLNVEVAELIQQQVDLTTLPHVGKGIAAQILLIFTTGKMPEIFKRKVESAPLRSELKGVAGLGKKRLFILESQLGIKSKEDLLAAIEAKKLNRFKWFTPNLAEKILNSITHPKAYEKLFKYKIAELIINYVKEQIEALLGVKTVIPTSSYRRKAELIGTVDMLVVNDNGIDNILAKVSKLDTVKEIVKRDQDNITIILRSLLQIQVKIIQQENLGAALLLHTGSTQHVDQLQSIAKNQELTLTEKGLFKNNNRIAGNSEEEIYEFLKLSYIEPELRENRGEIRASQNNTLPKLITLEDIKGDLHSHTNETDGAEPLEQMINGAIKKGYEYLAITDHSKRLTITNGLDEMRLLKQIELIDELNSQFKNFHILKSIEVDILEDGTLDLPNDVLKKLDLCVCSIHSKFKLPAAKQTERIIRAMDNPYFTILGHATGRLLTSRPPYDINLQKIMLAAKERGCVLELNAQPARLDINDEYCLMAKQLGVKMAISSDAHSVPEFNFMRFGINQARRGWLEKDDVINTRNLKELKKMLKR